MYFFLHLFKQCFDYQSLILGDIDVVAALGDSMTAATGANAVNALEVGTDNRGLSFSIGGKHFFSAHKAVEFLKCYVVRFI